MHMRVRGQDCSLLYLLVVLLGGYSLAAHGGDWRMQLGSLELEGISVAERFTGEEYHLSLTNITFTATMTFAADNGGRPVEASARRISFTGFEPDIQCRNIADSGLRLIANRVEGRIICQAPAGEQGVLATFNP